MTGLTEFVLARITEDEAMVPQRFRDEDFGGGFNSEDFVVEVSCIRWLADCAAKRALIEIHAEWTDRFVEWIDDDTQIPISGCGTCAEDDIPERYPCQTLLALAAIWSQHPDFDATWGSPT